MCGCPGSLGSLCCPQGQSTYLVLNKNCCVCGCPVLTVFVVHKNNLPTKCSTRTDVCVLLTRQSGQSLLSRVNYLLSARQGLMCLWLHRQSGHSLLSTSTIDLLSTQQGLMCVCMWLPRQSGQSLLSTRTIYLLSAQQGLMCVCVWLPRQSWQSLLSTRSIYLLSAQQGLMCVWLPRQSGQSLLSTRTICLLSAQQGHMCVCGCPGSLGSLCCPQGQSSYLVLNKD